MPKTQQSQEEQVFVGVAVLYNYLKMKAEQEEQGTSVQLALGEELTEEEKELLLPEDAKELIRALGATRCFRVLVKEG